MEKLVGGWNGDRNAEAGQNTITKATLHSLQYINTKIFQLTESIP